MAPNLTPVYWHIRKEMLMDNYLFLYRFPKLLKAPKLPVSTWLTPQTTPPPVSLHLDSDLPSRWNGDRGFVESESVHGLCLVISTSTGLTEAKKGSNLDTPSLCFPPHIFLRTELHHDPAFELCFYQLLNFAIFSKLSNFLTWLLWT